MLLDIHHHSDNQQSMQSHTDSPNRRVTTSIKSTSIPFMCSFACVFKCVVSLGSRFLSFLDIFQSHEQDRTNNNTNFQQIRVFVNSILTSACFTLSIDGSLLVSRTMSPTHTLMSSIPVPHLALTRAVCLQTTFTFPDTFTLSLPTHNTPPDGLHTKLSTVGTQCLHTHTLCYTNALLACYTHLLMYKHFNSTTCDYHHACSQFKVIPFAVQIPRHWHRDLSNTKLTLGHCLWLTSLGQAQTKFGLKYTALAQAEWISQSQIKGGKRGSNGLINMHQQKL